MAEFSKTTEELKLLQHHFTVVDEASKNGDSFAIMWIMERRWPEDFGNGEWVNVRAILAKKYPDLNLESDEDVLATVDTWEASALILEKHFPDEFGYREWKPKITYHNV